jgi:inositol phosphorylceramide mannosyltransferase catalytic subunit
MTKTDPARPSLSVCLMTAEPPDRVAAALEPVRELATEVVIAADSRVPAPTLAAYAELADRLLTVEFRLYERHLGWLHAQCAGDWILRLDGDEVPSEAFARRLPALLARRDLRQVFVRRAWLHGGAAHVLEDEPWAGDFLNRLVRNDGSLYFTGDQHEHADAAGPAEWLSEPVYHLELVSSSLEARRDKAIRYEVGAPLRRAAGGGRLNEAFYLPELRASLRRTSVAAEDVPRLRRALAATHPGGPAAAPDVPYVPLAEMDRHWAGRAVAPGAHSARIEPLGPVDPMLPNEGRRVFVRVANTGTERWPWALEHRPHIRLAYRWRRPDGSVHTADGVRTAFPRTVEPGDELIVGLHVVAPSDPGEYVLAPDVVHEQVTWFGCEAALPVRVSERSPLPPEPLRLREDRRPLRPRRLRASIPRALHRVWLGGGPLPEPHRHFGERLAALHPGWRVRLWGDGDLPELGIGPEEAARARSAAELSNLARYEVLHRHGGVYLDTDVECLRPFDELASATSAFAGLELPGRVGTAVLGSVPGHPVFARAVRLARSTLGLGLHSADANGPYMVSLLLEQEPGVRILGADRFYPYSWDEPERGAETFPDATAVHHWALSWWRSEERP